MSLDAVIMRVMERLADLESVQERNTGVELPAGVVAVKRLVLGLNLSLNSTVITEMSTSYRISHAIANTSNVLILLTILTITLGAGEGAGFSYYKDGVFVGVGYGNFAGVGSDNRVIAAISGAADTNVHTYSPGWVCSGAYQIDHFGGGVANGLFLLIEAKQ